MLKQPDIRSETYSLLAICFLFLFSCSPAPTTKEAILDGPNIVFILADDMGWNEVGYNSKKNSLTPHIDQLRKQAVSMTQFYVHAVCAPSRAAFLTGRYPFRNWSDWRSEDFGKPSYLKKLGLELRTNEAGEETRMIHALPGDERTIAEALADRGYHTAIMGKWGCGEWLPEHLPMGQGFQQQYGHYAWGIDYNNYTIPHNAPARFAVYDWHRNQKPLYEQGYSTDLIANETVRLLEERKSSSEPFFFYVAFNAVHGPLEEIPRYRDEYTKRDAAIKCLDDGVGRILAALDQNGLTSNTLVVFTNDNGAIRDTMNAPYRGTKNTNYEGGVRAPCLIKWPGKIEGGSTSDAMMHIVDFFPTLVSIGGGSLTQPLPLDGMDMTEVITAGNKSPRDEIIFEVSQSVRFPAIRQGDYKLIGEELFDIIKDPQESKNIAEMYPQVFQRLTKRIAEVGQERPPLPDLSRLMTPALPWIYGQQEDATAPTWVKDLMKNIRTKQPQSWAEGETPWPQAPKDGIIIYSGDGR